MTSDPTHTPDGDPCLPGECPPAALQPALCTCSPPPPKHSPTDPSPPLPWAPSGGLLVTSCCAVSGPGPSSPAGTGAASPPSSQLQHRSETRAEKGLSTDGALCPGLGPEQLVLLQEEGWSKQSPFLPPGSAAQTGADAREAGGPWLDWSGAGFLARKASAFLWKHSPSGRGGRAPLRGVLSQQGAVWPCPPTKASALSTFPPVLVTCLKVGSGCQPVPGQTPCPF